MCILSYLPQGVGVDRKGLYNGGMNNPDGHGWAIISNDYSEIFVGKSMYLGEALDDFERMRKQHIHAPALFHSRWATHGTVDVDNVHPFHVAGSNRTVVAHNGVFHRAEVQPEHGDRRSDTRIFADEVLLNRFKRLDKPTVQQAIADWCTPSNKLVILTVDPRFKNCAFIVNQERGQWDDSTGIWHSNSDYKSYRHYAYTYTGGKSMWNQPNTIGAKSATLPKSSTKSTGTKVKPIWSDEEFDICPWCETGQLDARGYCYSCMSCVACAEDIQDCICLEAEDEEQERIAWEETQGSLVYE